ncbi:MAG TPA: glycosyltransferase domain-containing protein [Acidimicrobiia bacterium]|nr:glycosyltransferase domain-containing protein [Acidimicrobiia bacterium]
MTLIYTGIFGGYDVPLPQVAQTIDVTWVCFTDDPRLRAPDPWETVCISELHPARRLAHPRMRTIWFKCQPWLAASFATRARADGSPASYSPGRSIWIDGNTSVFSPRFAAEALEQAAGSVIAAYRHNQRDCIYEEAEASVALQPLKYADQSLAAQVEHYRNEGHPEHYGLWAAGTLVIDGTDPLARSLGTRWFEECERWSYQTQLSLPVVLRELGITPAEFRNPQIPCELCATSGLRNPWFHIGTHQRDD